MKQLCLFLVYTVGCVLFPVSCKNGNIVQNQEEYIPDAPVYSDTAMWFTVPEDASGEGADVFYVVSTWELDWKTDEGMTSHYADVWSTEHRKNMSTEISRIQEIFGKGNNFYSPFYRHITLNVWMTRDEDYITDKLQISMGDVKEAFDYFLDHHNSGRPIVLAGFSQGGRAVVELLKYMDDRTAERLVAAYVLGYKVTPEDLKETSHIRPASSADDLGVTVCYNSVKDVKYINNTISSPCAFCINPVNWRTDTTPAVLHDTITVTVAPKYNVLVLDGYEGKEYAPVFDFINVGDFHSAEPWLYSGCLSENVANRVSLWYSSHSDTVTGK